jgi:hypothetical protein
LEYFDKISKELVQANRDLEFLSRQWVSRLPGSDL